MIKRTLVLLMLFFFCFFSFARDYECWLRGSYDSENGKIVKNGIRKYILAKKYFPLRVYVDLDTKRAFKQAVSHSIKIWNNRYNDYLNQNSERLVWKGVPIGGHTGLNNYMEVIPAWNTGELFLKAVEENRYPDVVIKKDTIGGSTLGRHEPIFISDRPPRFFRQSFTSNHGPHKFFIYPATDR